MNTTYTLKLNADEAKSVAALASKAESQFKIIPKDEEVAQRRGASSDAPQEQAHIGENAPGTYAYEDPRADHTATVAYLFKGEDGRWKVMTGTRSKEAKAFPGKEALPGGFVDLKGNVIERPEHTAAREMKEETGVAGIRPQLVRTSDPLRDLQHATRATISSKTRNMQRSVRTRQECIRAISLPGCMSAMWKSSSRVREQIGFDIRNRGWRYDWLKLRSRAKEQASAQGAFWDSHYPDGYVTMSPMVPGRHLAQIICLTVDSPGSWEVRVPETLPDGSTSLKTISRNSLTREFIHADGSGKVELYNGEGKFQEVNLAPGRTYTNEKGEKFLYLSPGDRAPASDVFELQKRQTIRRVAKESFDWTDSKGNKFTSGAGAVKATEPNGHVYSIKKDVFDATYEDIPGKPGEFRRKAPGLGQRLDNNIAVPTLEGVGTGHAGDWLMTGGADERYVIPAGRINELYAAREKPVNVPAAAYRTAGGELVGAQHLSSDTIINTADGMRVGRSGDWLAPDANGKPAIFSAKEFEAKFKLDPTANEIAEKAAQEGGYWDASYPNQYVVRATTDGALSMLTAR